MEPKEVEDVQALINIFFPFAEELVIKLGKFIPYAGAITIKGEYVSVGNHDQNIKLDKEETIAGLKQSLRDGSSGFLVAAVFYEARVLHEQTGAASDAIAVFVEHKNDAQGYEFFYPYHMEGDNFLVNDSFGNTVARQIFE